MDVAEPEPLSLVHPLLTLDNIILTPHIASASRSARDKMAWLATKNLIAGLEGKHLQNCVNQEAYK